MKNTETPCAAASFLKSGRPGDRACLLLIDPIMPVHRDVTEVVLRFLTPIGTSGLLNIGRQRQFFFRLGFSAASEQDKNGQVALPIEVSDVAAMVHAAVVVCDEPRLELAEIGRFLWKQRPIAGVIRASWR
jgi:hypothetical protein